MEGVTEGRIVHYVLETGPNEGEHRPAIIVRVWNQDTGMVQLQVFTDGSNDGAIYAGGMYWATSVHYDGSETPANRTWHWPERQ